MLPQTLQILFTIFAAAAGLLIAARLQRRSATDVCEDLARCQHAANDNSAGDEAPRGLRVLTDDLGQLGLFSVEARRRWRLSARLAPAVCALAGASAAAIHTHSVAALIYSTTAAWGAGYIITRIRARTAAAAYRRSLEYHLPMVMERVVMAVEAGLDIIAAASNIIALERENEREAKRRGLTYNVDPVTRLLEVVLQLSEAGLQFERSLQEVANAVDCSALKHALVHLALAQKEGGELIMPLRELSDATQLYYQETVEEEIAALPVKAVLPLVFTFAGLIICFITSPIVQVLKITAQSMPH